MDAGQFLIAAHKHMGAEISSKGLTALDGIAYTATPGGLEVHTGLPNANVSVAAGLDLCTRAEASLVLFAFRAEPAPPDCPAFDAVLCGTFYERGAPIEFRPFVMEWRERGQAGFLGWFEWAGEGEYSDLSRLTGELNRLSREAVRVGVPFEIASETEAETADYTVCVLAADDPGEFADNCTGPCAHCRAPIVWRPHAPKRPPKVCIRCAIDLAAAQ